ncbi:hypothetical protein OIU78_011801, partial [Salix suchowensis]
MDVGFESGLSNLLLQFSHSLLTTLWELKEFQSSCPCMDVSMYECMMILLARRYYQQGFLFH